MHCVVYRIGSIFPNAVGGTLLGWAGFPPHSVLGHYTQWSLPAFHGLTGTGAAASRRIRGKCSSGRCSRSMPRRRRSHWPLAMHGCKSCTRPSAATSTRSWRTTRRFGPAVVSSVALDCSCTVNCDSSLTQRCWRHCGPFHSAVQPFHRAVRHSSRPHRAHPCTLAYCGAACMPPVH